MVYATAAYTMGRADRATWAAMESRCDMKLRYMNAEVYEKKNMQVKIDEQVVTIPKALVFKSYDSICAVYWEEEDTLYLLPRYDYSRTTARQLTTFLKDFCRYPDDTSIIDVRKWCKDEAEDTVLFANSYRFDTQYIPFRRY